MFIRMKESKGFTLVELMIVVAIIGILAAVAVPYYQRYIQKSRLTSLVFPGVHAIQTNVASYYSLNSVMPGTSTFLTLCADANTAYFTPNYTAAGTLFTFQIANSTTGPLAALSGQTLQAVPTVTNGKIVYWTYTGKLATTLGLVGVQ